MKTVIALGIALLLLGCAPMPSLEELEAEAEVTGDWSAVEQREAMLARRAARYGPSCPAGKVSYCEDVVGKRRCTCVAQAAFWR